MDLIFSMAVLIESFLLPSAPVFVRVLLREPGLCLGASWLGLGVVTLCAVPLRWRSKRRCGSDLKLRGVGRGVE